MANTPAPSRAARSGDPDGSRRLLADLLQDNAALHAAYGMIGGPAAPGADAALSHLAALRERTSDPAIAAACDDFAAALRDAKPATVDECRWAMERPTTTPRERNALLVREQ